MDKTMLYDISYGMYVVTTKYNNKNVGCIANSFCQITSDDLIVSISLNKNNFTNKAIKKTKKYALSIISEKTNPDVIKQFGFYSSDNMDKFKNFNFDIINNLPVINENTTGYIMADVFDIIDAGTHDIFLAKVNTAERYNNFTPMTYAYYHKVIKGKAPKNAPTYIEEKIEKGNGKKYKCTICNYIYDDEKEKIKFADLPNDWVCPLCGAPKALFKQVE